MSLIYFPNLFGDWKRQKPNFLQLGTVLWETSLNTLCELKIVQLEQEYLENYIYTLDATKGSKCACALQGAPIIVKEFNIFWFDKTLQSCHRQSWMWKQCSQSKSWGKGGCWKEKNKDMCSTDKGGIHSSLVRLIRPSVRLPGRICS